MTLQRSHSTTRERGPLLVEVVTPSGRAAPVEFRFHGGTMAVWTAGWVCGVFDCAEVRAWLADSRTALTADDVTLTLDRSLDFAGRVAITLPNVQAWALSPANEVDLRSRL